MKSIGFLPRREQALLLYLLMQILLIGLIHYLMLIARLLGLLHKQKWRQLLLTQLRLLLGVRSITPASPSSGCKPQRMAQSLRLTTSPASGVLGVETWMLSSPQISLLRPMSSSLWGAVALASSIWIPPRRQRGRSRSSAETMPVR